MTKIDQDLADYHKPVLLDEVLEGLRIKPDGVYVDVTYGGGGHSKEILNRLNAKGRLFGFDQDEDAEQNCVDDKRFVFVRSNFKYISQFLEYYGIGKVDGVLADLGVSSHQFDEGSRGFSYRFEAHLDMRMNQKKEFTAIDVLSTYSAQRLQTVFSEYGEVRNAKSLSVALCEKRETGSLKTVDDLNTVIGRMYRGDKMRYMGQVYQALRIEVNSEMRVLRDFLSQAKDLLAPEARLAVITFHSIEDRLVKQFFKNGNWSGRRETDEYGRDVSDFKSLKSKPIVATKEELELNRRAASAKLRIIEKK